MTEQGVKQTETGTGTSAERTSAPFDDIISRLRELRSSMKPAERRVADVVLGDIEFAVRASNTTLAAQANVSEPTVTRFCRTLGCEGVRDLWIQRGRIESAAIAQTGDRDRRC